MGMSAGGSSGGAKSDINVTPLVDVCLVLLIIFMVMVPRNVPEISVQIPPESKTRRPPPPGAEKPGFLLGSRLRACDFPRPHLQLSMIGAHRSLEVARGRTRVLAECARHVTFEVDRPR